MITTSQIKDAVLKASTTGASLLISKYKDSSGVVADIEVEFLPNNGYQELVKESRDALLEGKVRNPGTWDHQTWSQAVQEQIASYGKTLAGGTQRALPQYESTGGGYMVKPDQPDQPDLVIIQHLKKRAYTITEAPEKKPVKSAAKTLAKAYIRGQLPLKDYVGQLNLAPGKLENITVCEK